MHRIHRRTTLLTVLVCWLASGMSYAADTGDKVKVQGLIIGRTARNSDGENRRRGYHRSYH